MARVYKSPVFCNLMEKVSLYQFWKNNLIYWKKNSNFHQDFVFIFPLKFELSGEYWSRGQVKWFDLANVWVIKWLLWESISEGSTGIQKQLELLKLWVIEGSSYWECTVLIFLPLYNRGISFPCCNSQTAKMRKIGPYQLYIKSGC